MATDCFCDFPALSCLLILVLTKALILSICACSLGEGLNHSCPPAFIDIDSSPPFSHATRISGLRGWLSESEPPHNRVYVPSCPSPFPRPRTIVDFAV